MSNPRCPRSNDVVLTARFSHLASREIPFREIAISNLGPVDANVRTQGRLDDEQVRQLASGYEDGATIRQLTEQFGVSRTTVMRYLHTAEVETRYRNPPLTDSKARHLQVLYESGKSIADIAAELELTKYVVGKELRRAGIQIRPRGFQPKR